MAPPASSGPERDRLLENAPARGDATTTAMFVVLFLLSLGLLGWGLYLAAR